MITVNRSNDRLIERGEGQEAWVTLIAPNRAGPLGAFDALGGVHESILPPGSPLPRNNHDAEVVTYVRTGTLAWRDALGRSGELYAGEFQRMNARQGARYSEANPSASDTAHVFQVWLRASSAGLDPRQERRRFSMAERRGLMCVVASKDARNGSLRVRQDALVISAVLGPGQHVVHALAPDRCAWLHVVQGEVSLNDLVLGAGDGAGLESERAASFTARDDSEILLVDLPVTAPASEVTD